MDLELTPEEQAFREEFSAWLRANLPDDWKNQNLHGRTADEAFQVRRAWQKKLGEAGWLGIAWPREYGGRGASLMEQIVWHEELIRAGAPGLADSMGLNMIGPTIIEVGTEEQKRQHLGGIMRGDLLWCQGFSEPNAGSDLASLQTRADLDGDEWIVNGQKIWSSGAQYADWCALLARTDQQAPKHRGITFFLVDMRSPGISVRPIRQMTGESEFNEVFFENVRVPRANVLGEVNAGWRVANRLLTYERGVITMVFLSRYQTVWQELRDFARTTARAGRPLLEDPRVREHLAQAYLDIQLMRLAQLRYITWYQRGRPPAEETSFMKLHWARAEQALFDTAMLLGGPDALLMPESPRALAGGTWTSAYLYSRAVTIYGGTQDIQRNIIAERIFGLPR